jgi:hypothetical protein
VKLNVRKPAEVVADVASWRARLEGILGGAERTELQYLAGQVALFSQALEVVERAVLRRREERQAADAKALELALRGPRVKESKGPRLAPGAPQNSLTHTGPHPEGSYAPRN